MSVWHSHFSWSFQASSEEYNFHLLICLWNIIQELISIKKLSIFSDNKMEIRKASALLKLNMWQVAQAGINAQAVLCNQVHMGTHCLHHGGWDPLCLM